MFLRKLTVVGCGWWQWRKAWRWDKKHLYVSSHYYRPNGKDGNSASEVLGMSLYLGQLVIQEFVMNLNIPKIMSQFNETEPQIQLLIQSQRSLYDTT